MTKTIGVMSDSHDQFHNIEKALQFFEKKRAEFLIHCGDWISPNVLRLFKPGLKVYGVIGNNPGDQCIFKYEVEHQGLDVECAEMLLEFQAFGRKLGVFHRYAYLNEEQKKKVFSGVFDAVFSGHDHDPKIEKHEKTLFVDPGTLIDTSQVQALKEAGHDSKPTVALYYPETNEAEIIEL